MLMMDTQQSNNDRQYVVTQIFRILNAIVERKVNGETISAQHKDQQQTSEKDKSLGEQAKVLTNKATTAFQEGRYDDVKKNLKAVLDIIEQLPVNNDHMEAKAYMLNMLAGAECRQGLYDMSVKHLKEAIEICEQLPDTVKYQYAKETFEENLENVEYKMEKVNEHKDAEEKESDESLLDALQNKSSKDKKTKSRSFTDLMLDGGAWWLGLIIILLAILMYKYC